MRDWVQRHGLLSSYLCGHCTGFFFFFLHTHSKRIYWKWGGSQIVPAVLLRLNNIALLGSVAFAASRSSVELKNYNWFRLTLARNIFDEIPYIWELFSSQFQCSIFCRRALDVLAASNCINNSSLGGFSIQNSQLFTFSVQCRISYYR